MFEDVKDTIELYRIENKLIQILFSMNIVQFVIIVVLIFGIISLFPLKEKEPYLVKFSNAEMAFAQVKKADKELANDQVTREALAVSYVVNKETKNNMDDSIRQETVRVQSNVKVWQQHRAIVNNDKSVFQRKDYIREVDIITVNVIPDTNIAQVDFRAKVKDGRGSLIDEKDFRAVFRFDFTSQKVKFDEMSKNPLGYKVTEYSLSVINHNNNINDNKEESK